MNISLVGRDCKQEWTEKLSNLSGTVVNESCDYLVIGIFDSIFKLCYGIFAFYALLNLLFINGRFLS